MSKAWITSIDGKNEAEDEFGTAYARLKAEHERLLGLLTAIRVAAERRTGEGGSECSEQELLQLRDELIEFLHKLDEHAGWQKRELFPWLETYCNARMVPSIQPSIWVMQKDRELAELFVRSFLKCVDSHDKQGQPQISECLAHLVQACRMLQEHLSVEEEVVFPMAEQLQWLH
ncbi:hemerythrin domain-containing protein [Paenibacillus ginsengihumi]|uniref:hemerythrin domain-containing protein n=1 Tax=Paenibacillus ginsengihumi TaxID=431596 RepID=UPI0003A5E6F5|nr:hemerythrin domain-containing protein [Paenibacillus ginsengihumi]